MLFTSTSFPYFFKTSTHCCKVNTFAKFGINFNFLDVGKGVGTGSLEDLDDTDDDLRGDDIAGSGLGHGLEGLETVWMILDDWDVL